MRIPLSNKSQKQLTISNSIYLSSFQILLKCAITISIASIIFSKIGSIRDLTWNCLFKNSKRNYNKLHKANLKYIKN